MSDMAIIIETLIKATIVLAVTAGMGAFATFIERKVLAFTTIGTYARWTIWTFTTPLMV